MSGTSVGLRPAQARTSCRAFTFSRGWHYQRRGRRAQHRPARTAPNKLRVYGGYKRFVVPSSAMTKDAVGIRPLDAHRHQNIERALGVLVLDECRRPGVGELEYRDFTLDLRGNVEQIA